MSRALQTALEHYQAQRLPEAEAACRKALDENPRSGEAYHLLGVIAHRAGKNQLAIDLIETATDLEPSNPQFLSNLGEICLESDRVEDAEEYLRLSVALAPGFAAAHSNLGNVLKASGRAEEAVESYRRALELAPSLQVARLNLALALLLQGNYAEGLPAYESRFDEANLKNYPATSSVLPQLGPIPRWRGEPLHGGALLVWTEQGFGDSLMIMRYLPLIKERGIGRLVVYCEPALARVMQCLPGVDEVASGARFESQSPIHAQCPLMSLPLVFETRMETIPRAVPYLGVPAESSQKWARVVADVPRPRIGLTWASGKLTRTPQRDIGLENLRPLLEGAKASFVSLQKDAKPVLPAGHGAKILDWMDRCEDFLDTAALIEQLDLVVSVDTAVAHLAGALGKPVWLMNRFESAWQWLTNREDAPWYPTARLFTQRERGNWSHLTARIAAELARFPERT